MAFPLTVLFQAGEKLKGLVLRADIEGMETSVFAKSMRQGFWPRLGVPVHPNPATHALQTGWNAGETRYCYQKDFGPKNRYGNSRRTVKVGSILLRR